MKIEEAQALDAFGALSQPTRLQMIRTLVMAGRDGMAAGAVGEAVGVSSSSASFHLAHLERTGLIQSRRAARSIIYTAHFDGLSALVEFLMRDCCQGDPGIAASAGRVAEACCAGAAAG